jgi:tRNA threonylcarbamoyladenosine biosynthesis protein TsaB
MILAIETSTREASLAVRDRESGRVVHESVFTTERAHNAVIFGPVESIVKEFRTRLSGIVVGLGPGSYGGVRVGIAVANGLSIALGLPVAGRSSLEAWNTESDSYFVVGDARRGTFFVAEVVGRSLQGEPVLVDVGEIKAYLDPLREKGFPLFTPDPKVTSVYSDARLSFPLAEKLASLFGESDFESGVVVLEPHYLRAPYITFPKGNG